jgi:hypothetical protein
VTWVNAAYPTQYGGVGIPNLQLMGFTLRLHWLWLARVDSDKTWSRYFFQADQASQDFFDASVQVDDGSRASFDGSLDRWLNGDLWSAVPHRIRKSPTVRDALSGKRWIRDITFARTVPVVIQSFVFGITYRTSTCLTSPTSSSGNGRLPGNSPLAQHIGRCFRSNLVGWC